MVLEARGSELTPSLIRVFEAAKGKQSVDPRNLIYAEQVAHVANDSKQFHFMCGKDNVDPKHLFYELCTNTFTAHCPAPFFNHEKRA